MDHLRGSGGYKTRSVVGLGICTKEYLRFPDLTHRFQNAHKNSEDFGIAWGGIDTYMLRGGSTGVNSTRLWCTERTTYVKAIKLLDITARI